MISRIGIVSQELTGEEYVGPEEANNNWFMPPSGVRGKGVLILNDIGSEIFEDNKD